MQFIGITSKPPMRIRKLIQMTIYHIDIERKDLHWLRFDDEGKVSKETASRGLTVLYIRFCSASNNSK